MGVRSRDSWGHRPWGSGLVTRGNEGSIDRRAGVSRYPRPDPFPSCYGSTAGSEARLDRRRTSRFGWPDRCSAPRQSPSSSLGPGRPCEHARRRAAPPERYPETRPSSDCQEQRKAAEAGRPSIQTRDRRARGGASASAGCSCDRAEASRASGLPAGSGPSWEVGGQPAALELRPNPAIKNELGPDPVPRPVAPPASSAQMQPLAPERYRVQFTARAELRDKLARLQELMRSSVPDGDLAAIIERAVTGEARTARGEALREDQGAAQDPRGDGHLGFFTLRPSCGVAHRVQTGCDGAAPS